MTNFDEKRSSKNFSQIPLLWLAICFAGGILAAHFVRFSLYFWLTILIIAAVLSAQGLIRKKYKQSTILLFFAFIFCGAFFSEIEKQSIAPNRISQIYDSGQINFKTPVELTGALSNEPEQTPNGYFLTLRAEKIIFNQAEKAASGAVRLFLPIENLQDKQSYENLQLHYDARIKVLTKLTRENRFRNPGGADYKKILAQKDLDASGTIRSPQSVQRLEDGKTFSFLGWLYTWRANLVREFKQKFSIATTGVLAASLLNNRYFLDKPTAERFREGGTFHVLVISGVHITFIGFLMVWLVRKLTKNIFAQFFAANFLLWTYTIAVGAEAPVTRAALMFTIFHAATLFYRENISLNSLGAAALILLVLRPADFFEQSFQLTFFSVLAIVAMAFPVLEKMRQTGAWQPAEKTPIPPNCAKWLKTLCETLFWSERNWNRAQAHSIWKARLFKSELAKKIDKWNLQTIWQIVFGTVFVSVTVTAWLLPLMAIYFHRLSLAAIFLNVFVGFLIAIVSFVSIFALLIAQISPALAQPFVAWTEVINYLLVYSAEPFIHLRSASIRLPVYTGATSAIYWIYYAPLICLTILIHRWNPFELKVQSSKLKVQKHKTVILLTAHCLLLTLIVFHPFSAASTNGKLRVDFLDVGQGDAALITTPNGIKILVDGGGRANFAPMKRDENGEVFAPDAQSIGEAVVCEFLWEKGFDRVDFLVATHADTDHIDGLNDVARNFHVQNAFVARSPSQDAEFLSFARTLEKYGVPVIKLSRGEILEINGAKIEILYPEFDANPKAPSDNNHSLVFRLIYGSRSFLFTGDIEAQAERFLIQQPEHLACDVVKVAHHGSRTSSTENFVRAANAKFAVISVGRESPYGHPHPQTIENWKNAGANVLTTGENGTISFMTDGSVLEFETFVNNTFAKSGR